MEHIKYQKSNQTGKIIISRPEVLNALNYAVLRELDGLLQEIEKDAEIRCLIITGSGAKAFAAGADIAEMKDMDVFDAGEFSKYGNKVFRKIELLPIPVIAAVNGYALGGGCELSLCCDIRIATNNAIFAQPEVSLGIIPGFGGTQRLARMIGAGKAKELLFTGSRITADEALEIGLVNKVVSPETLMAEAMELAGKIVEIAPIAIKYIKEAVNRGLQCDMDTAICYETEVFAKCFASKDQKDAMQMFLDKKKANKLQNK